MDIAKDLDQALVVIEKHVAPVAKETFELLVRQNFIEGIFKTSILLMFLFTGIFGFIFACKNRNKLRDELGEEFLFMITLISIIIITICILVLGISGGEFILKIFNPKYYAIMDLINIVK